MKFHRSSILFSFAVCGLLQAIIMDDRFRAIGRLTPPGIVVQLHRIFGNLNLSEKEKQELIDKLDLMSSVYRNLSEKDRQEIKDQLMLLLTTEPKRNESNETPDNGANSLNSTVSPTSTTLNSTLNSTTAPSTTSPSTTSSTTLSTKSTRTTSTTTSTTTEPTTTVTTTTPKEIQWTLKECTISPKNGKTIEEIKTNWLKELKNCIANLNNTQRTNSSVALVEVDDESMQCMAHQRYAAEFINQTIRQNYTVGNKNTFLVFNFKSQEELMAIDNVGYIDSGNHRNCDLQIL